MATQMTFDNLAQSILAVHHIDRQVITKKSDAIGLFDGLSKKSDAASQIQIEYYQYSSKIISLTYIRNIPRFVIQ